MRLHLSIQRNGLPTVDIVFSTGSVTELTGASTATIADLIQDVNALVPLKSSDGEWGLEDYVVEVAGKQKLGGKRARRYECLHFQPLTTVLREDDEVTIRAMGEDELNARKVGGRVQTTRQGRPVVDGVVWGYDSSPASPRPEVSILPRKKRKLLTAEPHKSPSPAPVEQVDEDETSKSEARLPARSKKATKLSRTEPVTKHDVHQATSLTTLPIKAQPSENTTERPKPNPPGQGLPRTKKKNERTRLKRRLKALQQSGELPAHATFAELRKYEETAQIVLTDSSGLADELEAAKARLLKGIDEMEVELSPPEVPAHNSTIFQVSPSVDPILFRGAEVAPTVPTKKTVLTTASRDASPEQAISAANTTETRIESPVKRAKLNIAASRRLLFGSLGLRTPKNAAEEQALREQLSQNFGPGRLKEGSRRETGSDVSRTASSKSWKDKLIIGAVECVQEDLVLPPPPFPFIQHWHRKDTTKESEEGSPLDYDGPTSPPSERANQVKGIGSTSHVPANDGEQEQAHISESRTISFETEVDALPIPANFEDLGDLERTQALPGTVIAYKEIHVGADTNFQPQVSAYRVAEIVRVEKDGWITMKLSNEHRRQKAPLDPETGQKVSNNFEIESSQDEVDDGIREMSWDFLLQPKLVRASRIQVPGSVTPDSHRDEQGKETSHRKDDAVVLESLHVDHQGLKQGDTTADAVQVQIGTPRRREIAEMIREAGFDSAVDQDLNDSLLGDHNASASGSSQPATDLQIDSFVESSRISIQETGPDQWISSHGSNSDHGSAQDPDAPSSPSVSLQLTVDYPHVSHLESGESSAPQDGDTRNSSSHQDAQRVAPVPSSSAELTNPVADQADSPVDQDGEVEAGAGLESLRSREYTTRSQVEREENAGDLSFLGRPGFDGAGSSHSMSDADGSIGPSSDSSLPPLSELTSSQKFRRIKNSTTALLRKKQTRSSLAKVEKSRAPRQIQEDTEDDANEAELPASSQPAIKVSASQVQQLRSFSQIPVGTQTVDLTRSSSSPPLSPGNSDGECRPNGRVAVSVISGDNVRKRQTRAASSTIDDHTGSGMGTRRFLTMRKRRTKEYF
ncbi:hypothetical protein DV735_g4952, partial [Chaetothyriales sp. CBS 134920]